MRKKPDPQAAADLRHRAELRLRETHNKIRSKVRNQKLDTNTEQLLHELAVHQIELEMQNDELQIATEKLESALKNYSELYDFAPVGFLSIDETDLILESNLTGAAMFGFDRSQLIGRRLLLFISETSRPTFLTFLKNVFRESKTQACEVMLLKQGGQPFWASFRATKAVSRKGGAKWCRSAFGDISPRKQAVELTARETQVLRLIAASHANKQSAVELGISKRTVEKHRTHIMQKLDIHDTAGLTRYAIDSGILKNNVLLTLY